MFRSTHTIIILSSSQNGQKLQQTHAARAEAGRGACDEEALRRLGSPRSRLRLLPVDAHALMEALCDVHGRLRRRVDERAAEVACLLLGLGERDLELALEVDFVPDEHHRHRAIEGVLDTEHVLQEQVDLCEGWDDGRAECRRCAPAAFDLKDAPSNDARLVYENASTKHSPERTHESRMQ